jgi:hypothetical protein
MLATRVHRLSSATTRSEATLGKSASVSSVASLDIAHLAEDPGEAIEIRSAAPEEVEILRRPMQVGRPRSEKHRALEQKCIAMG